MPEPGNDPFQDWMGKLEVRHLAERTFPEVRRSLQALSSLYVERRGRLAAGAPLDGAGKRAAFALFYGPLHFLVVRAVVKELGACTPAPRHILDLGCGTGAAGAAWAQACHGRATILGIDLNPWAVAEAEWTFRTLAVSGRARRLRLEKARLPGSGGAVVAAFLVNELETSSRARLLERLLAAARSGAKILVLEPISRRAAPWWAEWSALFSGAGGRDDVWRFPVVLPELLRLLDSAAGLDHNELTARSLWIG